MREAVLIDPETGIRLPDHETVVGELRRLRERGLLRLRELDLPALEMIGASVIGTTEGGPRTVEKVLRQAADRLGDDDFGLAARYLFGLVQGTIGRRPTDLREAAAHEIGLSAETFRKDQERTIVARLADELLTLALTVGPTGTSRPDRGGPAPTAVPPSALSLPPITSHFTGRIGESADLFALFADSTGARICVLHGLPGVGKTALAIRAAHRLADSFPDGMLFLDLTGHSPQAPTQPATEVLDRMLRRIGVPGERIPEHLDDRVTALTFELSRRRMLIVLDDAVHADQVSPVLRAIGHCGVLITSRARLTGLDEAHHLRLDVMPRAGSVDLFVRVFGRPGPIPLLERIAERCGDLPLALRIAAARARAAPVSFLPDLLARLDDEMERLAELDDGTRSVAAAFAISARSLPPQARRCFLLLAGHPGPDLPLGAAGALIGDSPARARRVLAVLVERGLVEVLDADRYRFHDLLADFGRQIAQDEITDADRREALKRVIGWYLAGLAAADRRITPHRHQIEPTSLPPPPPGIDDFAGALAWVRSEEANLVGVTRAALEQGIDEHCWQLAYFLRGYLYLTKAWTAWLATHTAALSATRRLGDRDAEAMTLNNLGLAELEQGRPEAAGQHYEAARVLFVQTGNRAGENTSRANRSWVALAQGRFEEFISEMAAVHAFYQAAGAERNAAISIRGMALGEVAVGRPHRAIRQLLQALEAFDRLGLPLDTTIALNNLAEAHEAAGDHAAAGNAAEQALATGRACGSEFEQARALTRLGDLAAAEGDQGASRSSWRQAAELYERLRAVEAPAVRHRLRPAP